MYKIDTKHNANAIILSLNHNEHMVLDLFCFDCNCVFVVVNFVVFVFVRHVLMYVFYVWGST